MSAEEERITVQFSAVILAGGQSQRMGRDKAWLQLEGKPLIEHALDKVRALTPAEVFISVRADRDYVALNCPVLTDLNPGRGPMGGIERGLAAGTSPLLLVLAVDLPRMSTRLLRQLLAQCDPATGIIPTLNGEYEPLTAVYPKRCHALALEVLNQPRRSARDFAAACREHKLVKSFPVPADEAGCFANWNQPSDVTAASP